MKVFSHSLADFQTVSISVRPFKVTIQNFRYVDEADGQLCKYGPLPAQSRLTVNKNQSGVRLLLGQQKYRWL